jgi:hypothetical protein
MLDATTGTLSYSAVPNSVSLVSCLEGTHSEKQGQYCWSRHLLCLHPEVEDPAAVWNYFFLAFINSFITDIRLARNIRNTEFHLSDFEWNVRQSPVIVTVQLLQIIQGVFTIHVPWNMICYKFILPDSLS